MWPILALHRADRDSSRLFERLAFRSMQIADQLSPSERGLLISALARQQTHSQPLIQAGYALSELSRDDLRQFDVNSLSQLAMGVAKLAVPNRDEFFDDVGAIAAKRVRKFDNAQLSDLAWRCDTLGCSGEMCGFRCLA